jgi:hypothetical protein
MCSHTAVGKAGEQGVFEKFSTHLAVVRSTRISPEMSTSLYFADEPAEHDQLFSHSYLVGLNLLYHFQIEFAIG